MWGWGWRVPVAFVVGRNFRRWEAAHDLQGPIHPSFKCESVSTSSAGGGDVRSLPPLIVNLVVWTDSLRSLS